jgi:CHAD domain-containing protein
MPNNKNDARPRYKEGLTPKDPLSSLARNVLRAENQALRRHLPPRAKPPTPTQIHELRITARRIRVALRLFGDLLPPDAGELREEFRWFCRALGDVRDLDVYAQCLASSRPDSASHTPAWSLLDQRLARTRERSRARVAKLLSTKRVRTLVKTFKQFVDHEPDRGALRRWKSLRIVDAARNDARSGVNRTLKLGRKIDSQSPLEAWHRLRIRAKRLRYELEFYEAFRPSLRDLTLAAKRLQDTLGRYRDLQLAAEQLRASSERLGIDGTDETVTKAIEEMELQVATALHQRFAPAWKRFEKIAARMDLDK